MASVKTLQKFNKRVTKEIEALGAKPCDQAYHRPRFEIQTKAGRLQITLDDDTCKSGIFTIFSCFDEPERAKNVLSLSNASNLNSYSGKWNFHYTDADDCFNIFISGLKEIL